MNKHQSTLPHKTDQLFLSDGGLETTLIFIEGIELPLFAACHLLGTEEGYKQVRAYYRSYANIAKQNRVGFVLETATWRASRGWLEQLDYDNDDIINVNKQAINICKEIRNSYQTEHSPMPISGCIGPRGDGYVVNEKMTSQQAKEYHWEQIKVLRDNHADFISAFTMNYIEEAIGITIAAKDLGIPVVISFTVETDGKLPSGQSLTSAIQELDQITDSTPAYYMINCAHPNHFIEQIKNDELLGDRIHGIRANASCKSHEELDNSVELDEGYPSELGALYYQLLQHLPNLNVLGWVLRYQSKTYSRNF